MDLTLESARAGWHNWMKGRYCSLLEKRFRATTLTIVVITTVKQKFLSVGPCLCLCILAGLDSAFASALSGNISALPKPKHRFIVIAHRGLHNHYPENSLASFSAGAKAGVDFVEMDLRTTRDSVLVILHDATLNRTTDGEGLVSQWDYAALQKLKLKSLGAGSESIPTFEQALATCRDKVYIYLDFKSASVAQTMLMVRKYGMADQLIVYINSAAQYAEWRKKEPEVPLMLSLPDSVNTPSGLKAFLASYPAALLDGDYKSYSKEMLIEAATENIPVWPDIQSTTEAKHWESAVLAGLHGLQTDHPEALIRWLEQRGLR